MGGPTGSSNMCRRCASLAHSLPISVSVCHSNDGLSCFLNTLNFTQKFPALKKRIEPTSYSIYNLDQRQQVSCSSYVNVCLKLKASLINVPIAEYCSTDISDKYHRNYRLKLNII